MPGKNRRTFWLVLIFWTRIIWGKDLHREIIHALELESFQLLPRLEIMYESTVLLERDSVLVPA